MTFKIPLVKESFYKEKNTKKELIKFIKDAGKFSMGDETKKFEESFARLQNSKYCVYVSSGSAANLGLVQALKNLNYLKDGDNIAVSSLTWATNVMPLIELNLKPIPIDIDIDTLNISFTDLKNKFNRYNFKALFLTNVLSFSCNMEDLKNFCDEKSILLFEDNCESLGSEFNNTKLGNFGIAGTFSFFVGHQMSTIEGGCIVTSNQQLYEMLKMVRAHGWARDTKNFGNKDFYSKFTFYDLAYNLRSGEINAFIGNLQLNLLEENLNKRFKIFNKLNRLLKSKKSVYKHKILNDYYAPFAFTLVFKDSEIAKIQIDKFQNEGVEIRPIISGNIAKQPFFKKYVKEEFELPNCDIVHNQGFYFGINPNISKEEFLILSNLLKELE